jgi:hypothetical protein
VAFHSERPDLGRKVLAGLLLLGIVSNALANVLVASVTPYIVRHFETNNQNALIEFTSAISQVMLASKLVDRAL